MLSRVNLCVRARRALAYLANKEIGMKMWQIADYLGTKRAQVQYLIGRHSENFTQDPKYRTAYQKCLRDLNTHDATRTSPD